MTPKASPKRNVLLYGPPKSGKTAGACSAPGPVLLLNMDLPNASHFAHKKQGANLIEVAYESFADTLVRIAEYVHKGDFTFGGLANQATPIKSIVVDPVGELYRRMMEDLSNGAVSPSLPMYQQVQVHLERFCRMLCEAEINFVLTAHEFPVQDESSGEVEKLMWVGTKSNSQSMSQKLMGMVDIVGYTAVVDNKEGGHEYVAQLVNGKGRRGGDRFDVLGAVRPVNLTEWFAASTKEGT